MKILIAEDDRTSYLLLDAILKKWGYDVVLTHNGEEAWRAMQGENPPVIAIVDWMMPEMNGVEFCRKVRKSPTLAPAYIILLTGRRQKDEVVAGLEAGANDYMRKPFDRGELHARVRVGERVIELQSALVKRVKDLQDALSQVKTLQGLLPVCSFCKKTRNDKNYWEQLEAYIAQHTQAEIIYGVCPDCREKFIDPKLKNADAQTPAKIQS